MNSTKSGAYSLVAGGIAAILASACCLGPLVLVLLGFGGAWMSNLQVLEPFRPFTLAIAIVFLALAYRKLWQPVTPCQPGTMCAVPRTQRMYKALFWLVALLVAISIVSPYVAPFFY
ncbi:mercuric transport protein [Sulfuriferula sp. AH1]|uniref:mercuric ion transporter MerT n=1 Tax=Sulfuriferula sp. AH1 TaxID=1985873 RepID=UPI000B3B1E2F|nr:mercuric ion transporter MerT [Sulfuriferula sp. AH1]ARU30972.1 mercuric transport protein [Sulfuriferula sp. AH1]